MKGDLTEAPPGTVPTLCMPNVSSGNDRGPVKIPHHCRNSDRWRQVPEGQLALGGASLRDGSRPVQRPRHPRDGTAEDAADQFGAYMMLT